MAEFRCKVCTHLDQADIDADIAGGMSNTATAAKWGMSKDSVRRHRDSHLSKSLVTVLARRDTAGAVKALDRVEHLYTRASAVLDAAEAEGQAGLQLAALRELRGTVELLAKLTGELDERPQVQVLNVSTSAEWGQLRGVLMAALYPFPEAGRAVALALGASDV